MTTAHPTPSGATGRRVQLVNVVRFLRFAVEHCGIAKQYRPPQEYRDLIGKRPQCKPPAKPPPDHQFLSRYEAVQDPRWSLVIWSLGLFGLRPAELEY